MSNLLDVLKKNPFVLAPMASITDSAFRSFMKTLGAGIVVSELISATGFEFNSVKTRALMAFGPEEHPVGIQLFGDNPEHMVTAALYAQAQGADFIDLNFGCPVPKVVKKGAGSALLKDLPAMRTLIRALVKALNIPVTIKIRTGWDSHSRNAVEVSQLAFDEGILWVAIHGRTRAQGYEGLADWDFMAEVKAKASLPIIGNGDIVTATQAYNLLKQTQCDGVMIGRGVLKNPFLLQQAQALFHGEAYTSSLSYSELVSLLYETFQKRYPKKLFEIQFKKLVLWFATGFPYAAQLRKQVFQTQEVAEAYKLALDFFAHIPVADRDQTHNIQQQNQHTQQIQQTHHGFLMGGHG
jgi:tRNA-dihydrouridine synthase B